MLLRVARRLTADTRLLLGPNPDHHLDTSGPAELAELAGVVNELAERWRAAEGEVARQVSTARAEMEAERNRLAALMAELAVPVLVCNIEGRILLYNGAARLVLGDDPAIGLGRSVYGIVDRGLVTHALDRIREGATAHVATVLRDQQLLQVRLAPVHGADRTLAGFVLVLEDETGRVANSARRDALLRELSEGTRASLGSIRAAVENVLDSPEMELEERGATVAEKVVYDPEQPSYNSEAAQLTSGNPDNFVIIDFPETFAKVGPALARTGKWEPTSTFITDGLSSTDLSELLGPEGTDGMLGTAPGAFSGGAPDACDRLSR